MRRSILIYLLIKKLLRNLRCSKRYQSTHKPFAVAKILLMLFDLPAFNLQVLCSTLYLTMCVLLSWINLLYIYLWLTKIYCNIARHWIAKHLCLTETKIGTMWFLLLDYFYLGVIWFDIEIEILYSGNIWPLIIWIRSEFSIYTTLPLHKYLSMRLFIQLPPLTSAYNGWKAI